MKIDKTMKAVRLNAPNELEYCNVTVPVPGVHEVLCAVESVSICGTDPHIIAGEYPGFWPKDFPLIPGHEWAGRIVALGELSDSFGWKINDRVAGTSHVGCGYCRMCLEGRYNLCLNFGNSELGHRQYGHYTHGAYAEFICTSVKAIARIPDSMDYNIASCMDPFSIALYAVTRSGLEPGDTILINGCGAQGLFAVLCARSLGAGKILISGRGYRLDAAKSFGAIAIDYQNEDVIQCVKRYTDGAGVKRIIECSGTEKGLQTACNAVCKGGVLSVVSLPKSDVLLPVRQMVLNEVVLVGNRANPNMLEKAIVIAEKCKDELKLLITHEFPLLEYKKALSVFNSRIDNSLKVVMKP
jgi:threonine dehydrogenase-like Zn-dependent dehydrogenase